MYAMKMSGKTIVGEEPQIYLPCREKLLNRYKEEKLDFSLAYKTKGYRISPIYENYTEKV